MPDPRPLVAGSLCLVLGLAACGVRADADGDGDPVPPASERARSLSLPFDEYTLSPAERRTLAYAQDLLMRECMREHGMDWEVLPLVDEEDADPPHRRRYGVIEHQVAAAYGYRAPIGSRERERADLRRDRATLPLTEHRAAYGDDGGGGCHARAREGVMEGVPDMDHALLNSYIAAGFDTSLADPAVVAAFADWSECMGERGFDHDTPLEAGEDARWAEEGEPLPEEIEVATADVACKEEAEVVPIWRDAEAEAQRDLIGANPGDFALFARVREAQTDLARARIEELGP